MTYHCRRSSSTNASEPPGKAADHPRPARPTNPETACEERDCAPRSSSFTLLVVVEAAIPVAGVIGEMVRHRSAVDAATRDVLHDVGRLAAGHRLLQRCG